MKRIAAWLLALLLIEGLPSCHSEPKAEEPDQGTIKVINLLKNAEATSFPVDGEFSGGEITRFQLAQALNAAAGQPLQYAAGEAAGLGADRDGYWSLTYHMEGTASGAVPGDLYLDLACGMTEHVVRVTAHRGAEWGVCYVEGEDLYALLRHSRDRALTLDREAYEKYRAQVDGAVEAIYRAQVAAGQPFTGWEVTEFYRLTSYVDESDDSTINIYALDYAMLTDDPDAVRWSGQMALDSEGRVEHVGDIGRMASRYWWWGERWETAFLSRARDTDTEFEEARTALNENNPRE